MQHTKDNVSVSNSVTIKIVTSGYSDRFIQSTSHYTVTIHTKNGLSTKPAFSNRSDTLGFLVDLLGFSFDDAYDLMPDSTYYISGKLNQRSWGSRRLTVLELNAIDAYLKLHHSSSYTPEAVKKYTQFLIDNPLHPDTLAILQWKIAECDRSNIETWGHKNGHQAYLQSIGEK